MYLNKSMYNMFFTENVPEAIYRELSPRLKQEVNVDTTRPGRENN